jgi:DNA-binding NarL/FixJ family response regulator
VVAVVRVLVADDSPVFLDASVDVVAATPGFELAGTTDSAESAIALAESTRPDVVLMDIRMPVIGGLAASRRIGATQPSTLIVLMTAAGSGSYVGGTAYTVVDKGSLTPARLAELWRTHAV